MRFLFDPLQGEDWRTWWEARDETVTEAAVSIALVIVVIIFLRIAFRRVLGRFMAGAVKRAESTKPARDPEAIKRRAETIQGTIHWAMDIVIFSIAAALVLGELGFNVTALVAGFGVVGIAVGFGAQTFVKDVINGFFILAEDQYRIGDVVRVGDVSGSGTAGLVEDISPRRTVLRDLDGTVHFIPNSAIVMASNMTLGFSRINMNVGVAYKEDLEKVIPLINEVCRELQSRFPGDMIAAPEVLRVDALGDSSVDIKVYGDVRIGEQWRLMGELRRMLKNRFDQEGIEIPFPHRTVYQRSEDGTTATLVIGGDVSNGGNSDDD
jgi:small conductance mechanosensitive channel